MAEHHHPPNGPGGDLEDTVEPGKIYISTKTVETSNGNNHVNKALYIQAMDEQCTFVIIQTRCDSAVSPDQWFTTTVLCDPTTLTPDENNQIVVPVLITSSAAWDFTVYLQVLTAWQPASAK